MASAALKQGRELKKGDTENQVLNGPASVFYSQASPRLFSFFSFFFSLGFLIVTPFSVQNILEDGEGT